VSVWHLPPFDVHRESSYPDNNSKIKKKKTESKNVNTFFKEIIRWNKMTFEIVQTKVEIVLTKFEIVQTKCEIL
jgi:hypothetical protein